MNDTLHVLLIEDNPSDRILIIRELRREFSQLQVQEIKDKASFDAAIKRGEFEVAITDYQIRWINGLEVLVTVKQYYPLCPVIMFTNTGNEEVAVEAMKMGLDDYLIKNPDRYVRLPVAVSVALKRAEAQRQAARVELRLQGLLDRLKVGAFRANTTGLLECNKAFFNLLGVETVDGSVPPELQEIYAQLAKLLPTSQEREVAMRRADGAIIWVSLSTVVNTVEGEQVFDGLIEDVTARKATEAALQELNETLEQRIAERTRELEAANNELTQSNQQLALANQALEEFGSSVSHDLREPLRAIQAFSIILQDNWGNLSEQESLDYLRRIVESTQQADKLIQDLLAYSRLSRTNMSLQPINLSLVLVEVLTQLAPQIEQRQATVTVEERLGEVRANRVALVQVITNLVTNAIKFVAPTIKPQVRVSSETMAENWIRLWVEDNGIGVAPQYHQRIFNVFERLHGVEVYPGTGIGLAIVRKAVEAMGGNWGVESQLAQGSRFWIELPKAKYE